MEKVVQCECGFEARAEDETELVVQVQRHASESHGMALSAEHALLVVFRAQLDETVRFAGEAGDDISRKGI
jgi:hypothetical protein